MPTKTCLVCAEPHSHDAETCGACGEGSWSEHRPDPAPTAPASPADLDAKVEEALRIADELVDASPVDPAAAMASLDAMHAHAVASGSLPPDPAPTAPASPQGKRVRK